MRLAIVAALSALVLASVTGCESARQQSPSPAPPTAEPVFKSEEEALAAAKDAYAAYQAMSTKITAQGGRNPTRIRSYATTDYYPELLGGFESFQARKLVSQGESRFDTVSLTRMQEEPEGRTVVDVYLCSDVSAVRLVDPSGADVTPADRPNRIPLQVGFVATQSEPSKLLIYREDVWLGKSFC